MRMWFLAVVVSLISGCSNPSADLAEWPSEGRDWRGQRYVENGDIDASNFDRLGLAFEFRDFVVRGNTHRALEATALMADGTLYFSGPWGVAYAVDARTGEHRWTYDPEADGEAARNACCDAVNRGVAIAGERLFVAGLDGQLAAVDRQTGEELWKVDTIDNHDWNYSSTGAPQIAGDLVLIGNSGADMGARGYLSAYKQSNGELAWRFWVVPGDPANGPDENPDVTAARASWPKDTRWELGLGGNPWAGLAFDPETGTVFVGTGNGGPHPAWLRSDSGELTDQLYLSSIVALDVGTGRVKWHYQTTPADSWDYAATSPLVMAELEIAGEQRKVIMQAPKNGFFYVLDRETGELLQAKPYTAVNWASHVDLATGRPVLTESADYRERGKIIWPSMAGGHAWTPMAYSPESELVYLPVYDTAASFITATPNFRPGTANHGGINTFAPFPTEDLQQQYSNGPAQNFEGRLKALDPISGEIRWTSAPLPLLNGGTLVVGDIVLQGTVNGFLTAYDARTGTKVGEVEIGTSIVAAPMAYTIDGVQYIAVLAGYGGPQGGFFPPSSAPAKYENFERLVVLTLDGVDVPLPPALTPAEVQPMPAPIRTTPAQMRHGQDIYQTTCNRCHSLGGSRGIYPDLWNMAPATIDAFGAIVGQGAFASGGMGNFSDILNTDDIEALKAFIVNDTIAKRRDGPQAGAQFREATH